MKERPPFAPSNYKIPLWEAHRTPRPPPTRPPGFPLKRYSALFFGRYAYWMLLRFIDLLIRFNSCRYACRITSLQPLEPALGKPNSREVHSVWPYWERAMVITRGPGQHAVYCMYWDHSKHETLTQCWNNVGPLFTTLAQHWCGE